MGEVRKQSTIEERLIHSGDFFGDTFDVDGDNDEKLSMGTLGCLGDKGLSTHIEDCRGLDGALTQLRFGDTHAAFCGLVGVGEIGLGLNADD